VPDENIVRRISERRACLSCGATYHLVHIPPKVSDVCDNCGANLVLREDDQPETVTKRLDVYHNQTQPLVEYYTAKNVFEEVDGTLSMNEVFDNIVKILGE